VRGLDPADRRHQRRQGSINCAELSTQFTCDLCGDARSGPRNVIAVCQSSQEMIGGVEMKSRVGTLAVFLAAILLEACSGQEAVTSNRLRTAEGNTSVELAAGEKIATIAEWQADDLDAFVECLEENINRANPAIPLVSNADIRPQLLPSLTEGKLPSVDEEFAALLRQPDVRQHIDKRGLRYLVVLSGSTTSHSGYVSELPNGISIADQCSAIEPQDQTVRTRMLGAHESPPNQPVTLAQIGVGWEQSSVFFARVWDLQHEYSMGSLNSSATGSGAVAMIFLFPLVVLPETGKTVCKEMAQQLAQFFSGGNLPAEP
jgi:hypothetical protein